MNTSELDRAEAAASAALGGPAEATASFRDAGEDPSEFARLLAGVLVDGHHRALDEIPLAQALRVGVRVESLWRRGLGLETVLEVALPVVSAVSDELGGARRVRDLGHGLILAVVRSHQGAEQAGQREREKELRALVGVSRAVNRTLDPAQVAEAGLAETIRAMGVDVGAIWLRQGPAAHLSLAHAAGFSGPARKALDELDVAATDPVNRVLAGGAPVQFEVRLDDPLLSAYRSALLVPLAGSHGPLGLLAVGSRRVRTFTEAEAAFATAVTDHLAGALDHAFEHRREAHTDYLTGLANRSEFETSVRRQLAAADRHRRPLTLMLMDLDQLKHVNDHLGHHAGDEAIRSIAEIIRAAVRTSDISARLGGDEFGIAMPEAQLSQAREVAGRIQTALRRRQPSDLFSIPLELSFGVAQWEPGQDYEALFVSADRLLYQDKRRHQARRARERGQAGTLRASKPSSPRTSSPGTPSRSPGT